MTGGIEAWKGKGYPVIIENSASGTTETSNVFQEPENTTTVGDTSEVAEINYITADELNAKISKNEGIIILDVRSEDSYMIKHIKNAVNIPYRELDGRTGESWTIQKRLSYIAATMTAVSARMQQLCWKRQVLKMSQHLKEE